MISNSDFEKLWLLYKTEGEPKGISINAFCISKGINYSEFNKWFRKMHRNVVPIEIDGAPDGQTDVTASGGDGISHPAESKAGGLWVSIQTSDGLQIQKSGLSYQGLVNLVERLEGVC